MDNEYHANICAFVQNSPNPPINYKMYKVHCTLYNIQYRYYIIMFTNIQTHIKDKVLFLVGFDEEQLHYTERLCVVIKKPWSKSEVSYYSV